MMTEHQKIVEKIFVAMAEANITPKELQMIVDADFCGVLEDAVSRNASMMDMAYAIKFVNSGYYVGWDELWDQLQDKIRRLCPQTFS